MNVGSIEVEMVLLLFLMMIVRKRMQGVEDRIGHEWRHALHIEKRMIPAV